MVSSHPFFFTVDALISVAITLLFLVIKRPQLVIASLPPGDVGLGAIIACRISGTKYVVDIRDEWEDYEIDQSAGTKRLAYNWIKNLVSKILQKSCLVVTVTSFFAQELNRRGIKNVEVLPNGADTSVFRSGNRKDLRQKLGWDTNDFIIIYNGLIGDYYHFDGVLRALTRLEGELRNKTKLLLVGSGPDVPEIMRMVENLGLEKNVCYLGVKKSKKELAEILSAADVGIIPGLYSKGQLPVKLFEYGACGISTISIAPDDSLLTKLIHEKKIGINVPSMSEDALAKAILETYKNEPFRIAAGNKARKFVEEEFDRKKIAEEYSKRIQQYVNSS
jgi:glycosyltransferase involved in cell wall biosynthesis